MQHSVAYPRWEVGEGASRLRGIKVLTFVDQERCQGPLTFLEVRWLLDALEMTDAYKSCLHRYLRRYAKLAEPLEAELLGLSELDLRPSRRQGETLRLDAARLKWLTREIIASPQWVISMLTQWCHKLKTGRRAAVRLLLKDLLSKACHLSGEEDLLTEALARGEPGGCARRWAEDFDLRCTCPHVRAFMHRHAVEHPKVDLVTQVLTALIQGWPQRLRCNGFRAFHHRLQKLAARLLERGLTHPSLATNPEHLGTLRALKTRRRGDPQFLSQARDLLLRTKRFRKIEDAVRSGAIDASRSVVWEARNAELVKYIGASIAAVSEHTQLHLAFDESTVSREPTLVGLVWVSRTGRAFWAVPQVLPALKTVWGLEEGEERDAALARAGDEAALAALRGVCGPGFQVQQAKKKAKAEKVACYQLIRGLDHMLRLCGSGLSFFQNYEMHSRRLQPGEIRYLVPTKAWGDYSIPEGCEWLRSARKNVVTGEKVWETPSSWGSEGPSCLTLSGDEGPLNLAAIQYLQHRLGLRVLWVRDAAHRAWRDCQGALQDSSAWTDVLESLMCMQLPDGPWRSAAWWKQLVESAERQLLQGEPEGDAVFGCLYDDLVKEWGDKLKEPEGPLRAHELYKLLATSSLLKGKGSRVTMTRWFQWAASWSLFEKHYATWRYLYNLLALSQQTFQSVWDMPLFGLPTSDVSCVKLQSVKQTQKTKSMQESIAKESLQNERTKCKNAVHLACVLMDQPLFARRCRAIARIIRPVWTVHSREQEQVAVAGGFLSVHMSYVAHKQSMVLCKIACVLQDPEGLEDLGFDMHSPDSFYRKQLGQASAAASSSDAAVFGVPKGGLEAHYSHSEDFALGDFMWRMSVSLIAHRAMSVEQWSQLPPGQFCLLLARDRGLYEQALATQEKNWAVLQHMEEASLEDTEVKAVLDQVGWCCQAVPRDILTLLASHRFMCLPQPVMQVLNCAYRGPSNSACVERAFQVLEDESRVLQTNKSVARARRLACLLDRKLMDSFGLEDVTLEEKAWVPTKATSAALNKHTFDALGKAPSVDDEVLKEIYNGKGGKWLSVSAPGQQLQPAAWMLLVKAHELQRVPQVKDAWQAQLMSEGRIVEDLSSGAPFVVLKVCAFAALLWPADRYTSSDCVIGFQPRVRPGTCSQWVPVFNVDEWGCYDLQVIPPAAVRCIFGTGDSSPRGVVAVQLGGRLSLKVGACSVGFAHCTGPVLDKLIAQHEMCKDVPKKDRPRTVLEKVETCVKFFRPDISNHELGLILKERAGLRPSTRSSTLLTRENLKLVDGCMEEFDRKEAAEHAERVKGGGAAKQAAIKFMVARGYLQPGQLVWELGRVVGLRAAAAETGQAAGSKAAPAKGEWSWEEKALKKLIPKGVAASIGEVHNKRDHCWTARYPRGVPGSAKTCTRTCGPRLPSAAAARIVFTWLWAAHEAATGQACPHQLPAE